MEPLTHFIPYHKPEKASKATVVVRYDPRRRGGEIVKLFNVTNRTTATLKKIIRDHCEPGSTIHTDGWAAY